MPIYLDCCATTPLEEKVLQSMLQYLVEDYGNAGSRTHSFGSRAKKAVQKAREQVASVVDARADEVIFTSGATEGNNMALLGLQDHGQKTGRKHIISTQIEHKAVLDPLKELSKREFEVTLLQPNQGGWIDPEAVKSALKEETLIVSVMHVNNETGVKQPINEIVEVLDGHEAYFHVDAAQGFGKDILTLKNKRIDMITTSAHKIYGPKGVGALIARRRGFNKVPLRPLHFGGGQERGLRPGTSPVPLVVGLGKASEMALENVNFREKNVKAYRDQLLSSLANIEFQSNGDLDRVMPHVLNISFPGIDAEAAIVALKDLVAISNGSACTSQSYEPSHVLKAMGLEDDRIMGALRISWCHMTEDVDWAEVSQRIKGLSSAK